MRKILLLHLPGTIILGQVLIGHYMGLALDGFIIDPQNRFLGVIKAADRPLFSRVWEYFVYGPRVNYVQTLHTIKHKSYK
jgi:hypothetical protein